jgi:hypothetical protein
MRSRSLNHRRGHSLRLMRANEVKLEFSEKNYLTEAMNFRRKYLGSDSR